MINWIMTLTLFHFKEEDLRQIPCAMSVIASRPPPAWCPADAEAAFTQSSTMASEKVDSGCDSSSFGTESPTSYRRLQQDDNSTGSFSCSSCEATVDQNSAVYQQLAQTLAQARLNSMNLNDPSIGGLSHLPGCKSYAALINPEDRLDDGALCLNKETKEKHYDDDDGQQPTLPSSQLISDSGPTVVKSRKDRGRLLPQVLASLALAIAAMIEGYSSGYTSPALASMTHPNSTIPVNDQQASWIGSLMPLNALLGGIFGGSIIEKFGRKSAIMLTGPPYILCKSNNNFNLLMSIY